MSEITLEGIAELFKFELDPILDRLTNIEKTLGVHTRVLDEIGMKLEL